MTAMTAPATLAVRPGSSPDEVLDAVTAWAAGRGITLYPHQEEAALALLAANTALLYLVVRHAADAVH